MATYHPSALLTDHQPAPWGDAVPITYTHKGVQYVTVLSGRGGSSPNRWGRDTPTGGSVWTFALMKD